MQAWDDVRWGSLRWGDVVNARREEIQYIITRGDMGDQDDRGVLEKDG
jgi:hypothetical protein